VHVDGGERSGAVTGIIKLGDQRGGRRSRWLAIICLTTLVPDR
jgi:hypothetical protein